MSEINRSLYFPKCAPNCTKICIWLLLFQGGGDIKIRQMLWQICCNKFKYAWSLGQIGYTLHTCLFTIVTCGCLCKLLVSFVIYTALPFKTLHYPYASVVMVLVCFCFLKWAAFYHYYTGWDMYMHCYVEGTGDYDGCYKWISLPSHELQQRKSLKRLWEIWPSLNSWIFFCMSVHF